MMRSSLLLQILLALLFFLSNLTLVHSGKFAVSGPVLTVTLKEPADPKQSTSSSSSSPSSSIREAFTSNNNNNKSSSTAASSIATTSKSWIDLSSLRPNLFWSLQSTSPPLPHWLPFWKSLRCNVGYRYDELKRLPSFVETELKFRADRFNTELHIKPTHELKAKRSNLLVQISKGTTAYLLGKFTMNHNNNNQQRKLQRDEDNIEWESPTLSASTRGPGELLSLIKASYRINFPSSSSAAISSLRITPTYDVLKQEPSCELEGITGGSSRTMAILKLNYDNPTLAVVHALDEYNTISPEIALYNAKIVYSWTTILPGGASSIRTRVDPTSAIEVQWTDTSASDGGRWVVDFKLPLEGTTMEALASDIKVRRQFNF